MPSVISSGRSDSGSTFSGLPQPQKIAVIFLFILAIFIVVFWVWQMQTQINAPFSYNGTTTSTLGATSATSSASMNLLKSTDTDHDGISDYDELYTYKTSPYLADSDSDGIPDLKEIEQGTNPNCPEGQTCTSATGNATSTSVNSNNVISSDLSSAITATTTTTAATSSSGLNASAVDQATLQKALNGQADAATIRALLIQSGANKTELDKVSDADLLKSYQETLQSQATSSATSTGSSLNNTAQ
jgi:hypothetical protein